MVFNTEFCEPRSAYVHVPFCRHRCGYCSFTVVAGRDDLVERYLQAIERELSWLGKQFPADTIYFGGGTPSHLSPAQLERLFDAVYRWFPPAPGCEINLEANPSDVDSTRIALLADLGVNRISLGVQSFDSAKLRLLERDHGPAEISAALRLAKAHIPSVSIDLIFGAPGETRAAWSRDLNKALAVEPDHISTYGLTYERGATFWSRWRKGELVAVDEAAECDMYETAIDCLTAAGMDHYEVSNFARGGHRCRHNEVYWNGMSFHGAGPGAARYIAGHREMNHRSSTTYLRRVLAGESPVAETEVLDPEDRAREQLVFGLRRIEGVARDQFVRQTGFEIDPLVGMSLRRFVALGLLEDNSMRIKLTRRGLLISDSIWPHFLEPPRYQSKLQISDSISQSNLNNR